MMQETLLVCSGPQLIFDKTQLIKKSGWISTALFFKFVMPKSIRHLLFEPSNCQTSNSPNYLFRILHHSHHKNRLHIAYVFYFAKAVHVKIVIAVHVLRHHFQHKIKLS